jgi:hypothetical protein
MRHDNVFKKTMTHYRSHDDASHHVRQHARMAISLLHTPFIFLTNHALKDAALNANRTI